MAGENKVEGVASLEETPTWAIAAVCFVLIAISLFIEHVLHFLAKLLSKKRKALRQALHKVESELMLFGFVSLLLEVTKEPISKICIPLSIAETFLPCEQSELSKIDEETQCKHKGKISLMSSVAVNQLQRLIFVFAVFHVLSSVLTFGLGMAKVSFLRQFTGSVSKTDYVTLRHGFIMAHITGDRNGKKLVPDPWLLVLQRLELDVLSSVHFLQSKWVSQLYVAALHSFGIGTKLQGIITKMCIDSQNKAAVVAGTLLVKPDDGFFWFNRPKLLLLLMHFILFQNSFQLAFFAWTWYKFGLRSCYHKSTASIVIKIAVSLFVQFLCGYVTLPLYALVTQMGTSMKKAVFTEHVVVGLKNWHATAKAKVTGSNSMTLTAAPSTAPSSSTITRSSSFDDYEIEMQPHDQPSQTIQNVSVEITEEKVHTDQPAPFKFW
ncbi:hypothetical protein Syun_008577 [Stephania yunnanensis]|uniref:MLO-like protein n=1 Tax=Stephania yunnanensis TaxID=152371 RepID=A0AAP0KCV9_9MAGN